MDFESDPGASENQGARKGSISICGHLQWTDVTIGRLVELVTNSFQYVSHVDGCTALLGNPEWYRQLDFKVERGESVHPLREVGVIIFKDI